MLRILDHPEVALFCTGQKEQSLGMRMLQMIFPLVGNVRCKMGDCLTDLSENDLNMIRVMIKQYCYQTRL